MTPQAHPGRPWFEPVAAKLGRAYLRYSFTKGSAQEAAFLVDELSLRPGMRVLDVGCGPGRHAIPLARAGVAVTGIDISQAFLDIAAADAAAAGVGIALFRMDARNLPFADEFDAALALCQGAFGLMGRDDPVVLRRMAEAVRPGGAVVVSAFNAYFEAAAARPEATLDPDAGIVHEVTAVRDEAGIEHQVDLWTSVYTPRELRLLALGVGLVPEAIWSVEPGAYRRSAPDVRTPELLMVAIKPRGRRAVRT